MHQPDEKYVYHGSPTIFETVKPKRNRRTAIDKNGKHHTIFDDYSFHATPYRWIGLSYTYTHGNCYTGVSLYEHLPEVIIYGFESLEKSLEQLYGNGGYLFVFEKEKFFHTQGLGDLEVITKEELRPLKIERIDDPVGELKKLGISFKFIDLAKPENRNLFK